MRAVRALLPQLRRAGGRDARLTTALAVTAFTVSTALTLSVVGGLMAFVGRAADPPTRYVAETGDLYVVFAWTALVLLVIPLVTLGASAARLGVSRRDARLATLRLLGVTPREVVALTVLETAWQGLVGAVAGTALYGLLLPVWSLVPFQGSTFAVGEMWVGVPAVLVAVVAVPVLAAGSGAVSLRRVVVSPLGVARRQTPRGLSWLRAVVALAGLGGAMVVSAMLGEFGAAAFAFLIGAIAVGFMTLNAVGPWVISIQARLQLRRARTPARLLAARRLLDDPRAAWRVVGGLGLAGFVAGILAIVPAFTQVATDDPEALLLLQDLATGAILTLVIAFLLAAVSAGISQAASVLDRRREFALQDLAGVPVEVLDEARRRQILGPLLLVAVGSAAIAVLLLTPMLGFMALENPTGPLMLVGCLLGGVLLVLGATETSRPLLRSVLRERVVRPD